MGLLEDARNIQRKDPAARSVLEVVLLYPGFHILVYHRIAHWLYEHKHFFLARWVSQHGRHKTGIEIHPGAKIGKCLFIDHGSGVIIGETAILGDNITLYQGVTLGGTGKEQGKIGIGAVYASVPGQDALGRGKLPGAEQRAADGAGYEGRRDDEQGERLSALTHQPGRIYMWKAAPRRHRSSPCQRRGIMPQFT